MGLVVTGAAAPTLTVRVWRVRRSDGAEATVATCEQPPQKLSMCEGCPAPCCQGLLKPVLTGAEFSSKRFPLALRPVPFVPFGVQGVRADYLATLDVPDSGCRYHDAATERCQLWPHPPAACLAYDCRDETRPELRDFAREREAMLRRNGSEK